MTRDERRTAFINRYADETTGLLLRAFSDAKPQLSVTNDDRLGRAFLAQLRAARDLLGRVFDDLCPAEKKPEPTQNGQLQPARKT